MGYFISGGEVTARKVDRQEGEVVSVVCSSCATWFTMQSPFKNRVNLLEHRRCGWHYRLNPGLVNGCGDYCNNLTSYGGDRTLFTIKPLICRLLEIPETLVLLSPA